MKIMITGGAGYIGTHTALAFLEDGFNVLILDNLSTGNKATIPENAIFYKGDCADRNLLREIFLSHKVDGIIHMAGSTVVPESVEDPLKYYINNTFSTAILLEEAVRAGIDKFVFSSTAAIYGNNPLIMMKEEYDPNPGSPYASSKLVAENIIRDVSTAHGLNYIILRYFNVAGADPLMRTGQSSKNATHLIKVAMETALGLRGSLKIHGTDYDTKDGTCVRDYIHVSDLAKAHVSAFRYMIAGKGRRIFNCGYGVGYSVRDIIKAIIRISGTTIKVEEGPRRKGDPIALIADSGPLQKETGWKPEHNNIDTIIGTALSWERRMNSSHVTNIQES